MTSAKFSKTTQGIYPLNVFKDFPADAIDIPDDLYASYQSGSTQRLDVINGKVAEYVEIQTFEDIKNAQIATIDAAYAAAVQVSVSFQTSAGVAKIYQADNLGPLSSQSVLLRALTGYSNVGATPAGFYWQSEDNMQVPFTLVDLGGLYATMTAQCNAAFEQKCAAKAAIRAARTVPDVLAITW